MEDKQSFRVENKPPEYFIKREDFKKTVKDCKDWQAIPSACL